MNDLSRCGRPVAALALMALPACALTLVAGLFAVAAYTGAEPWVRSLGLTMQHLRPVHETFAFAWVFLGGVAVVHAWMLSSGGPLSRFESLRFKAMAGLWAAAGAGILVSFLAGRFTGREYAGYAAPLGAMILAGWALFAWNFFGRTRGRLTGQPVYVWMWTAAVPLFAITFLEAHAWTLDWVSRRPLRDIALQWKANGVMVGSFNLLAYGAIMYVAGRIRRDDRYAHSPTAFLLFCVGIVNTFTNYGHHTFHLPQSRWIHVISFSISMLEIVLLAKVMLDLWRLRRASPPPAGCEVPARFGTSVTLWTALMLAGAIAISVPPLNAMIHGTHIVTAHAMGTMIGIDSMILWMALSWALRELAGASHPAVRSAMMRRSVPVLDVALAGMMTAFVARGLAAGATRYFGPSASDWSRVVEAFPYAALAFGGLLAVVALGMVVRWTAGFVSVLRSAEAPAAAPAAVPAESGVVA
jgi:nitric oxide reductase subunit B